MEHMHSSYVYIFSCCMRQSRRRRPVQPPVPPPSPPPAPAPVAMDTMIDLALLFPLQAGMFPMKTQKVSFAVNKITKSCSLSDLCPVIHKTGVKTKAKAFYRRRSASLWLVRSEIRPEFLRELKEKSRHPKYTLLRALRKRKRVSRSTPVPLI